MRKIELQEIFALVPSVLSRYLDFSLDILLSTLRSMREAQISLPSRPEDIDGLSLTAEVSDDPEIENVTYNGWKTDHRITNVLVFSPKGVIIDAVLNAPGSWHDSHTARPIFHRLLTQVPDGFYLVADTAFPHGPTSISGKIKAPIKAGQQWGMRTMQGSFGRLRVLLCINSQSSRLRLLELCCRLFNVRSNCIGINQICSVYLKLLEEGHVIG
ncbi:hypothetical protein K435DRAFT_824653 [Dendrothele bispora CBS 962.96]|uniref:DDE Tnp4 domain-containing protein n=1 Tax=Dendrothele bispora (strain CBS 962.96) TaxID=1314807 RepID=A0A4S8KLC3_DENBC|nr:hypothetical protein K435DRAFT_824653 [Dendrothele bispora CBS 962.96]